MALSELRESKETPDSGPAADSEEEQPGLAEGRHLKGVPCQKCNKNDARMWLKNNEVRWICDVCTAVEAREKLKAK